VAGAAGLGGELAVAVAVGADDGEIIGPAGGRDRRRLTAHAAIQCRHGGRAHDHGGGCSTGWLLVRRRRRRRRRPGILEGNDRWFLFVFFWGFFVGPK